ncbi:hypothetical protein M2103_000168 [Ereboglobus sp. PH5-5]|nr:hypothetical protein [Ereboglobus sp. PH5-10]MDF9831964.1 hypothetical protein [Ereboglobus sp. PH5-5]
MVRFAIASPGPSPATSACINFSDTPVEIVIAPPSGMACIELGSTCWI